jgi:hypothetical protein
MVDENTATSYLAKQKKGKAETEKSTLSVELCSMQLDKNKE